MGYGRHWTFSDLIDLFVVHQEFWPPLPLVDGPMIIVCFPSVKVGPNGIAVVMSMFMYLF